MADLRRLPHSSVGFNRYGFYDRLTGYFGANLFRRPIADSRKPAAQLGLQYSQALWPDSFRRPAWAAARPAGEKRTLSLDNVFACLVVLSPIACRVGLG